MALSPANYLLLQDWLSTQHGRGTAIDVAYGQTLDALMDAARAQGRASLEERLRDTLLLVEQHADYVKGEKINRTHIARAAAVLSSRVRALLATPGERENG